MNQQQQKPLHIGIVGFGVVGSGVVEALVHNSDEIFRRAGQKIVINKIAVRDRQKTRPINFPQAHITDDWKEIVDDPHIEVVVELIGGDETAYDVVCAAIDKGKHVVTANKALLAKHGNDIFEKANHQGVMVAFEATVAGGIPIIKALREGLAGNHISEVVGIINGTCNYILSEMFEHDHSFSETLVQAQQLGYAEADPTFDVEGTDAQHKLAILGALAFGSRITLDQVYVEGIRHLQKIDIEYAQQLGYRIKLLGIARRHAHGIELRVHPTLIPSKSIIANVEGVMNAVRVKGNRVGTTLLYGAGAGAAPTSSAIVADLLDVARLNRADPIHRVPYLAFQCNHVRDEKPLRIETIKSAYYLRIHTLDCPGVLADITRIFANYNISIDAILQYKHKTINDHTEVIFLIYPVLENQLQEAMTKISTLSVIQEPIVMIRRDELLE